MTHRPTGSTPTPLRLQVRAAALGGIPNSKHADPTEGTVGARHDCRVFPQPREPQMTLLYVDM